MNKSILLGDAAALALTTTAGFATHGETDLSFLPRFLAIYLPLTLAWILLASPLQLFRPVIASTLKQIWRVPLVMLFAAPLAVAVRSLILQTDIVPIFIVALGGTSALGIMLWRIAYHLFNRK